MKGTEPLLPPVDSRVDYEALRVQVDLWPEAMKAICLRHGLPTAELVRFGDGSDPAFGSNVVFAVGKKRVIKLFPPYQRHLFEADVAVARHVYGKIGIMTPEIEAHGSLDQWPYIIMSRLQGIYLAEVWDTLGQADRLRIVVALAEVVARLHALATEKLVLPEAPWPEFIARRLEQCVQHHRQQDVPETWLEQMPAYLTSVAPLYPVNFKPAIVSADIHQYHLLAQQEGGRWQLSGLFDFDDALIGYQEYDLAAVGLFMLAGQPQLLRSFLLTYGYSEAELSERLSYRLLAYTLLHRYRPFNWIREEFAGCSTLEELARAIYAL